MSAYPALAHPPAWMCHPCQDAWAAWGSAELTTTQLDGGGEGRRRQIITQQREDIAARCSAAQHDRNRQPTPTPTVEPDVPTPTSLLGARAKQLLDEFEALLPADGRTREERVAAAVESERVVRREQERTRQPWRPKPASADEEVA